MQALWRCAPLLVLICSLAHSSVQCARVRPSFANLRTQGESFRAAADWNLSARHYVQCLREDGPSEYCDISMYERCKTPSKCSHKLEIKSSAFSVNSTEAERKEKLAHVAPQVYHNVALKAALLRDVDDGEFELSIGKDTFTLRAIITFCPPGCVRYKRKRAASIILSLELFLQKASSDSNDIVDFYPNGDRCIDRSSLQKRARNKLEEVGVYAMQPLEFHQFVKVSRPMSQWRSKCLTESWKDEPSCSAVGNASEDLSQLRSCIATRLRKNANSTLEEVDFDTLRVLKKFGYLSAKKENKKDVLKQFKKEIFKTRTLHKKKLVEVYGKTLIEEALARCFPTDLSQKTALNAICLPALYDLPAVTGHGLDEDHNAWLHPEEYRMPEFQTVEGQPHHPVEAVKWKSCPNIPPGCARWAVARLAPAFSKQQYSFWKFNRFTTELNPFNKNPRMDWKQCLSTSESNCQLFPHCVEMAMRRACAEEHVCCPNWDVHAACAEDPDGSKCKLCERTSGDFHLARDYANLGVRRLGNNITSAWQGLLRRRFGSVPPESAPPQGD